MEHIPTHDSRIVRDTPDELYAKFMGLVASLPGDATG